MSEGRGGHGGGKRSEGLLPEADTASAPPTKGPMGPKPPEHVQESKAEMVIMELEHIKRKLVGRF